MTAHKGFAGRRTDDSKPEISGRALPSPTCKPGGSHEFFRQLHRPLHRQRPRRPGSAAAAPLKSGSRLGASLSVKDRRLIEATLTLTGQPGKPLGFLANRTIGAVGWPDLTHPGEAPEPHWLLPDIRDKVSSDWHAADARLAVLPHPVEEMSLLGEVEATGASVGWLGITVAGAVSLPA